MIFKFAFARRVREVVRVLRGLPPDEISVRERTLAINEQLARLRATRIAQQKQREEAALREVQVVIEEMQRLKESLSAAEEAAVEFVNQIGDHAQAQLEDEWEKKAEIIMAEMTAAGEPTIHNADLPAASLPLQQASQEPLIVSKSRTTVVETRATPPKS